MAAQHQFEIVGNDGQALRIPAAPPTGELVTPRVLQVTGLNAQDFSGDRSPSSIYRAMVTGDPSVFGLYRELEEKDWEIGDALELRKLNVLGRSAQVIAADPKNAAAKRYAEGLAAFLQSIRPWRRVLEEALDSRGYGYTVQEILWRPGNPIGVDDIVGRPQELFRFGRLSEPQNGPLRLAEFPGGEGQPVPEAKFIVSSFGVRNGDRRGRPLLRRVFWLSWFKRNGLRLDLQFLEKPAGTVVVKYPDGAEQSVQDLALTLARAVTEDSSAAAPESFKVMSELLYSARTRAGQDFSGLIDYCDSAMRRLIQKQTLTSRGSDAGKGTQALGRVHEGTEDEVTRNDALDLEEAINEQLCAPWLAWTFGPQALDRALRPWWTIEKEPPKDAERELRIMKAAHGMLGPQSRIASEQVYQVSGLRVAEEGEDVLPPPAPTIGELLGPVPPAEPGAPEPGERDDEGEGDEQ
jgi:phage gp29-like protein